MASKKRSRGRWASRFHFLVRFLGLTGLVAVIVGAALAGLHQLFPAWDTSRSLADNATTIGGAVYQKSQETIEALIEGQPGDLFTRVVIGLLVVGGAFALLLLLLEGLLSLRYVLGRRSAFGTNALLQVALAVAIVVAVNYWYAFSDSSQALAPFKTIDCTRDRQFTLPAPIQAQLRQLRESGKTQIAVYKRHKTFGSLSEKPDRYDYAAEEKVAEKVRDLVAQFREFGPQFEVVELDVERDSFDDDLKKLPEVLRQAVNNAPENSIFFHHQGKVQRLSFNDFYQLDKTASQEANDGKGNLVLRYQGVEPFAHKVLNVEEKKPRVAVGVIHEVLSMEGGSEEIGMGGVKKALEAHGFDTRDLILKKWSEFGPPEPAVLTFDESRLEQLDEQIKEIEESIKTRKEELSALEKILKQWQTAPLAELRKTDVAKDLDVDQRLDEGLRKQVIARVLEPNIALRQFGNEQEQKELERLREERQAVSKVEESLAERRRDSDLKAKTARVLADCDLLIVPRMTLFNVARDELIRPGLYRLDPAQVAAIKDFVRSGKPVLVCLGPINEAPGGRPDLEGGADALEEMLSQLGFRLTKQTVLFNVETKSFAQRRGGLLIAGANVEVPPLKLDWEPGAGRPAARALAGEEKPNALHESLRLTARSLGKGQTFDVRLRHPRPVYYDPVAARLPQFLSMWAANPGAGNPVAALPWGSLVLFGRPSRATDAAAEFLMTDAESWNESQPFPTRERTPRYEPPKPDDPSDPYERRRLGPFPVGVAAEVTDWTSPTAEPTTARVAVIGHGGVFMGPNLSPAREKLLLDVSNWLLGRDERLVHEGKTWSYPRVALDDMAQTAWVWGAQLGLPALFFYFGLVVLMLRRVR